MPPEEELRLDLINKVCTWLFVAELVLKWLAFDFRTWACDPFNLFDFVVVAGSLPEVLIPEGAVSLSFMRLLRLLRLLRSLKALRRVESVRVLLRGIQSGARETVSYIALFALFLFTEGLRLPLRFDALLLGFPRLFQSLLLGLLRRGALLF